MRGTLIARILHRSVKANALHQIVLFSSAVLDASFGSEGNPEEPSGAEGSGHYDRNYGRCLVRCLALQGRGRLVSSIEILITAVGHQNAPCALISLRRSCAAGSRPIRG